MTVLFNNNGGFVTSFSVQWSGGGSDRTPEVGINASTTIDLNKYNLAPGTGCWAEAYIEAGPNHQSGQGFNYQPDGNQVSYSIDGATIDPSFSCVGCTS
jgi:hypothetical protein